MAVKFWDNMNEKSSSDLLDDDILMIGDSIDRDNPKHSKLSQFRAWISNKLGVSDITSGNIPVVESGKLLDSQVSADSLVGSIKTVYLNKQTGDGQGVSDFRYKNTPRGMVVVLPVKGADGQLLELAGKHIKVSFWLNLIRDAQGVPLDLNTLSVFQYYYLCFEYKRNGQIIYSWLNLSLAEAYLKRAQVKDLYGKVNEALIAGDVTWSSALLGASVESKLTSQTNPPTTAVVLTTTYNPHYAVSAGTGETVSIVALDDDCSVDLGLLTRPESMDETKAVTFIVRDDSKDIIFNNTTTNTLETFKAGQTIFCIYTYFYNTWEVNSTNTDVGVDDYSDVFVKDAFKSADLTLYGGGKLTYTNVVPTANVGDLVAFLDLIGIYPSGFMMPGIYRVVQKDVVNKFIRVQKVSDDFTLISIVRVESATYRGMWQSTYSGFSDEIPVFERLSDKLENKLNILTASAGAATYTLSRINQNEIQGNLPSGVASTIVLADKVVGEDNQYIVHFTTGATAPTLVYSGFTPLWPGGTAPTLAANKAYSFVFEHRYNGSSWYVKASFGEY